MKDNLKHQQPQKAGARPQPAKTTARGRNQPHHQVKAAVTRLTFNVVHELAYLFIEI